MSTGTFVPNVKKVLQGIYENDKGGPTIRNMMFLFHGCHQLGGTKTDLKASGISLMFQKLFTMFNRVKGEVKSGSLLTLHESCNLLLIKQG